MRESAVPEPDDGAGPDEAVLGAARRAFGHVASVAGRMGWRRLRRQWVIHQMARKRPAPIVRKIPTPLTTVDRTVYRAARSGSWPSAVVTEMFSGNVPEARVSTRKLFGGVLRLAARGSARRRPGTRACRSRA